MSAAYEFGKEAHAKNKKRDPMRHQAFLAYIQTKVSAEHHPSSPGANMNASQRKILEQKITEWKRGWDDAHQGK